MKWRQGLSGSKSSSGEWGCPDTTPRIGTSGSASSVQRHKVDVSVFPYRLLRRLDRADPKGHVVHFLPKIAPGKRGVAPLQNATRASIWA